MKSFLICSASCLLVVVAVYLVVRRAMADSKQSSQVTREASSPADRGTALVKRFYMLLLQPAEPTKDEEDAVLKADPGLEKRFVVAGMGKPGERMRMRFLRKHKQLFTATNARPIDAMNISSTFNIVGRVGGRETYKPAPGYGMVMVVFADDTKVPGNPTVRRVFFTVEEGRLDIAATAFSGDTGDMLEVFLREVPLTEEQMLKIMREEERAREEVMRRGAAH